MRVQKMVVLISLVALAGCSSSLKQSGGYIKQPEVCIDRWYGYHLGTGCPSTAKAVVPDPLQEMAARLADLETQRSGLANELVVKTDVGWTRLASRMEP